MRLLISLAVLIIFATPILAQRDYNGDIDNDALGCMTCSLVLLAIIAGIILLALSIWATIWVYKDAKKLCLPNANFYLILMIAGIFFRFWLIVWLVYILTRPKQIRSDL